MIVKEFLKKDHNNLDIIRIICALLVIVGHTYRLNNTGATDIIEKITKFTYTGGLAVTIFFFISGMLVTHSLLKNTAVR